MYDKTVRRRRAVLLLLVVSSLILVTAYFGESSRGGLHSVQRGIMEVVSPIQEGASRALKPVRDLFGWAGDTVSAKGDLKDAREERDAWQERAIRNEAALRENARLRGLLDLDRGPESLKDFGPVTARVNGRSPTLWYGRIYIDKGTSAGVRTGMPVVASDGSGSGNGLIGRVEIAGGGSAIVRLITDATVAVSARTVGGGTSGVVAPKAGNPRDLVLDFTDKDDRIAPRDVVVTAGTTSSRKDLGGVYPPDVPIGQVTRIEEQGTEDQEVHVKPFVDVRRIEYVQVLTRRAAGGD